MSSPSNEPPRDPQSGGWTAPTGPGEGGATGYGTPGYGIPGQGTPGYGIPGQGTPGYGIPGQGSGHGPGGWVPKPGIVPLRPLGVGEILDGAVTYIRRYPALVLGASAVVAVVVQLVTLLIEFTGPVSALDPAAPPSVANLTGIMAESTAGTFAASLVSLVGGAILSGLLMVVISRAVLGAPVAVGEAWQAARPRILGLIGVSVLSALAVVLVLAVVLLPGGVLLGVGATGIGVALLVLGAVAAVVLGVWIGVSLSLAAPAYVLEGIGVVDALKRSWRLVQPRFWPIFGTVLLAGLIAFLITLVLGLLFTAVAAVAGGLSFADPAAGAGTGFLLVTALGSIITMTVYAPFNAGVVGLLYVDQRMRREGFDIELQRAAGGPPR